MKGFWNSKYIDFWSIPHFLFGAMLASLARAFDVSVWGVALAMFIVAVLWEVFEVVEHIPESRTNGVIDVVLAIVGFVIVAWLLPLFSHTVELILFAVLFVLWLDSNVGGFIMGGWRSWVRKKR